MSTSQNSLIVFKHQCNSPLIQACLLVIGSLSIIKLECETLFNLQVCQETSPEFFEGAASGIAAVEADPDICAPVIHDTITSSPPDNDLLGAVPFSIATESSLFLSEEPLLEQEIFPDVPPTFEHSPKESPSPEPVAEMSPPPEPTEISFSPEIPLPSNPDVPSDMNPVSDISCVPAVPVVDIHAEGSPTHESFSPSLPPEADFGSAAKSPVAKGPCPETVVSSAVEEEDLAIQSEDIHLSEKSVDIREPGTVLTESRMLFVPCPLC